MIIATLNSAWYLASARQPNVCLFAYHKIQSQIRAFVSIGEQKYETCCVRCAIVEARQTSKALCILKVADFDSGRLLDPDHAWFVEGSRGNLCMRTAPETESPGGETAYQCSFDRCSPGTLAFSSEQCARTFMAQYGGALKCLAGLQSEATSTAGKV